ncbi:hypothetical protein QBC47DRAFT_389905 [Echria macrotheca]|uniref:Glycosyltransferase family 31 protein n=1 Tax=Echria macrotheca TaxID=438768 RepID=A0AAJ0F8H3_9PEZI|nr:hypothetical protein QBC47DRAFT_389905 [Echria macrotheca]
MLYRRIILLPYGRAKAVHAAVLLLFGLVVLICLRLAHHRRSIYDVTEGKTSGPWKAEWSSPIKPPHGGGRVNGTHGGAAAVDADVASYLVALGRKYGLTSSVPFVARRVRADYSSSSSSPKGNKESSSWWSFSSQKQKASSRNGRPSLVETDEGFLEADPPLGFVRARLDYDDDDVGVSLNVRDDAILSIPLGPGPKSATPAQVDASALLVAVSTTYARLMYADRAVMHDWARWLTDGRGVSNGAGLVVSLHGATERQVVAVRDMLRRLGIDADVSAASETAGDAGGRYAQLIQSMMRRRIGEGPHGGRKYFGLVDDDVFFPCVGKLLDTLKARFDPDKTFYIGVPSERSDWLVDESPGEEDDIGGTRRMLTYGGAAVFMTPGMLDMAGQLLCLQYTRTSGQPGEEGKAWDMLLYECIARHAPDVRLHVLPGLYNPSHRSHTHTHQITSMGGGYGTGALPLAMHRYRNYHRFEAGKGHLVTSTCGEACFLRRFLFPDGWLLVNGYTLTEYPGGVEAVRDPKLLVTQHQQNRDGTQNPPVVGERLVVVSTEEEDEPVPIMWKGRKKTFRLLDAKVRPNGEVWQAYVNRRGGDNAVSGDFDDRSPGDLVHSDDEERSDVDSVVLLIWEPDKE